MRNEHDAEDAVQEASLRAFRYFRTFTGGNGRAWFLRIVRNTCSGWRRHRTQMSMDAFDEKWHSRADAATDPETLLLQHGTAAAIDHAMNQMPERLRELFVLREIDGLSYRQIADMKGIPIGTVMSGLSRARQSFRSAMRNERDDRASRRGHLRKCMCAACRAEYSSEPEIYVNSEQRGRDPAAALAANQRKVEHMANRTALISRRGVSTLAIGLSIAFMGLLFGSAHSTQAAVVEGGKGPQLLIGADDDNQDNAAIQAGAAANQSLNRTDVLTGGPGNDVLFGLNGNDVIDGGPGLDIILGGPDGAPAPGGPPNSDIMFGGPDDDVNLWAPGDGSETFIGGPGRDALIVGATDRETVPDAVTNVRLPTLRLGVPGFPQGIPTANVSGLSNFCTIEDSPSAGYRSLVRFRGAAGNIIVTLRVAEVEQVFCGQGGAIAFADLTLPSPAFVPVSLQDLEALNPLVAAMIR